MPTTPEKNPEEGKKTSFWERLSQNKADEKGSGSLVDAIVRQAEKEASSQKGANKIEDSSFYNNDQDRHKARTMLGNARMILWLVIALALGAWLYFFAVLSESNYFYAKFDRENLTTEINRKVALSEKILTDIRDTKKFTNLLEVENLASRVLAIDIEDPVLSYKAPIGERVISRGGTEKDSEIFVKTTDENGKIIYIAELEIKSLVSARDDAIRSIIRSIEAIVEMANKLKGENVANTELKVSVETLLATIEKISEEEINPETFPSAVLKSKFASAQSVAKNILRVIKNLNLQNLVVDIKNQAATIDATSADSATQKVVTDLQSILIELNANRHSTFKKAIGAVESLGVENISDNAIYKKVVQIIGDPRVKDDISDLKTAAMIAQNIGRVNIVNHLGSERIIWSTVIERMQKIARLGADLERDSDTTPTNENRDLDPNGKLINLFSYSGESKKSGIEIQGMALAEQNYEQKSFTLIADLIDAIEASKYFKDVDGFTFSKKENDDGKVTSPFNLNLTLQDPAVTDERDAQTVIVEQPVIEMDGAGIINVDDINFKFDDEKTVAPDDGVTPVEALSKIIN